MDFNLVGIILVSVIVGGSTIGYLAAMAATAGLPSSADLYDGIVTYSQVEMTGEIPAGTGNSINQARRDQYIDQSIRFYRAPKVKTQDQDLSTRTTILATKVLAIAAPILLLALPVVGYADIYFYIMAGSAAAVCAGAARLSKQSQKTLKSLLGQGRNVQACCMALIFGLVALSIASATSRDSSGNTVWSLHEATRFTMPWGDKLLPWTAASSDIGHYLYFVVGVAFWLLGLVIVLIGLVCWVAALQETKIIMHTLGQLGRLRRPAQQDSRVGDRLAESFDYFGQRHVFTIVLFMIVGAVLASGWIHDWAAPVMISPPPGGVDPSNAVGSTPVTT